MFVQSATELGIRHSWKMNLVTSVTEVVSVPAVMERDLRTNTKALCVASDRGEGVYMVEYWYDCPLPHSWSTHFLGDSFAGQVCRTSEITCLETFLILGVLTYALSSKNP